MDTMGAMSACMDRFVMSTCIDPRAGRTGRAVTMGCAGTGGCATGAAAA